MCTEAVGVQYFFIFSDSANLRYQVLIKSCRCDLAALRAYTGHGEDGQQLCTRGVHDRLRCRWLLYMIAIGVRIGMRIVYTDRRQTCSCTRPCSHPLVVRVHNTPLRQNHQVGRSPPGGYRDTTHVPSAVPGAPGVARIVYRGSGTGIAFRPHRERIPRRSCTRPGGEWRRAVYP